MAEILAPAGSPEAVIAAVRSGADAVYLAGEAFNARRNAANFTPAALQEAVRYCHARGVKVYHALNTLVADHEIGALQEELERILACGEDALILQDLGVARIVKALCPSMPLHASTQLSAHTLSGVRALEESGFKRVVLARELSLEEIDYIRKNTEVELEVFVHGALCMCVSGQCLMSAFLGARSGNRGLCAQPCRLPFKASGGTGHDLSLKDNSVLEALPRMEALGIHSFKIEGRMKRPEYVAASVSACKNALTGCYDATQKSNLKNIFSRQGFTDGYLTAKRGREMFGARTKEDVTAATAKLLKDYRALYAKEQPRVACAIDARILKDTAPVLTMSALGSSVTLTGEQLPQSALNKELTPQELSERLSKLGGTQFYAKAVTVTLDEGLMLPAAEINALRREAAQQLSEQLSLRTALPMCKELPPLPATALPSKKSLYLRFADMAQAENITNFERIILPIEQAKEAAARFGTQKLILETPRVFFGLENTLIALLDTAKALGVQTIAAGNIGALQLAKERGFQVLAGLGMNVYNSYACAEVPAEEILLSPEMSTAQIAALRTDKPFGAIVYGKLPLMITRNCPLQNGRRCANCDKKGSITDRKGEKFAVRCRFGASEIFNPHALYMCDKEAAFPTHFSLLYFTTETSDEVKHILKLYKTKSHADFKFTRGLYTKGVL